MKEIFEIRDKVAKGELEATEALEMVLDILANGKFYTNQEIERIKYIAYCDGVVSNDTGEEE